MVGWPLYEVSSHGRVKRLIDRGNQGRVGILKPTMMLGRPGLCLREIGTGKVRYLSVQILVCTAFHGPKPSPKHSAAHWDGNKLNNHYANLRWATHKENMRDKVRHGTQQRGEDTYNAKLTISNVDYIKDLATMKASSTEVARMFGVARRTIEAIYVGKSWKHYKPQARAAS